MRIALFTYVYGSSGSGIAVKNLSEFLVSCGGDVSVFDALGCHDVNNDTFTPYNYKIRSYRIIRKIVNLILTFRLEHRRYASVNPFKSSLIPIPPDYDLYNFHWCHNDFISIKDISKLEPSKVFITQHDFWWSDGLHHIDVTPHKIGWFHKLLRKRNRNMIQKIIDQRFNFIFPSHWLRKKFYSAYVVTDTKKSNVIWNIFNVNNPPIRSMQQQSSKFCIAIAAWDISWYKGIDLANKIINLLEDNQLYSSEIEIHLFGDDRGFDFDTTYKIVRHGRLDQRGLFKQLLEIDVMLYTSRFDNLPNLLIEASLLDLPVVCLDIGGCDEIIKNGINGFVHDQSDLEGAAESLVKIRKLSFKPNNTHVHNRIFKSKSFFRGLLN